MSFRVRELRSWTASFGSRLTPPTDKRNLRQIIIHEHYAESIMDHEFDIAVVQLSSPVQYTSAVHRVCLPEATHVFPDNTTCYVTGWGALRDDGNYFSRGKTCRILRIVDYSSMAGLVPGYWGPLTICL